MSQHLTWQETFRVGNGWRNTRSFSLALHIYERFDPPCLKWRDMGDARETATARVTELRMERMLICTMLLMVFV